MPSRPIDDSRRLLWWLVALYGVASLLHFVHNAEYIAFYPNMPQWLTREKVYLAWLAITGVGGIGIALAAAGWSAVSAVVLAVYGALGLDGLGHYALALCTDHTLAMNATIGFEVAAGMALACVALRHAIRRAKTIRSRRPSPRTPGSR